MEFKWSRIAQVSKSVTYYSKDFKNYSEQFLGPSMRIFYKINLVGKN